MFIPDVVGEEHVELRKTVRRFLERLAPEEAVRRWIDTEHRYDAELWIRMAQELGLQGLAIPETAGGFGFGVEETTIVFEELGRAMIPSPFFATVALAAQLLVELEDPVAMGVYLPSIAAGTLIATVALAESTGSWAPETLGETTASEGADGWTVTGTKYVVLNADSAGLILVVVGDADGGTSVFAVDPTSPGIEIEVLETLDLTSRQATVRFTEAPAVLVGDAGGAGQAVGRMLDLAALALAADVTGAADHLMQVTLDYAKLRYQFGRPIGSYQAIKHKLAEMAVDVERMGSVVRGAASEAANAGADFPVLADMAKIVCGEASFRVAAETIQVHGGIGFTWEHPAHLYLRRVKGNEYLLGSPAAHRESLLRKLGA